MNGSVAEYHALLIAYKKKDFDSLYPSQCFYQHYKGAASIIQEREVTINKTNCAPDSEHGVEAGAAISYNTKRNIC